MISKGGVKGIAHITGGGFTDNIPRIFPKGLGAVINIDSWPVLPVFKWLQEVRVKCFHCLIEISICFSDGFEFLKPDISVDFWLLHSMLGSRHKIRLI